MENTKDAMIKNMSNVLKVDPSECHFIQDGEVAPDWFNLMFELPNKKAVLDVLCLNALEKAPWLAQCGVKAVKIGDKSEIYMQSPITRSVPTSIAEADLPCTQGRMLLLYSIIFHLRTACTSSKFMPLSWYRGWGGVKGSSTLWFLPIGFLIPIRSCSVDPGCS